jgi:membrane protein DedA with SNARE-associated domain
MNPDHTIIALLTEFHWPAIFIGSFLFGETVIITAAFLAAEGLWSLSDVFWISLAGTVVSDSAWFLFGQRILAFFKRSGKPNPRSERLLSAIENITGKNRFALILCVKFIYGTRIFTIMYLSMRKMHYGRFAAYDTISSTLWLTVICAIGWLAGKSVTNLVPFLNTFEYAALFLILVIAVFKIGMVWISRKIAKE